MRNVLAPLVIYSQCLLLIWKVFFFLYFDVFPDASSNTPSLTLLYVEMAVLLYYVLCLF